MAATIKDVAKLAGVSPSKVTRVLQDKSSISEATKNQSSKSNDNTELSSKCQRS